MLQVLKSPLARISFGLVLLTVMLLLVSDMLGMVPDTRRAELKSRRIVAESLAVQLSTALADEALHSVEETLRYVVERNADVLSAGLRDHDRGLIAEFGGHSERWTLQPGDRSTATQIQVPLFDGQRRRGTVELGLAPFAESGEPFSWRNSFVAVIVLVGVSGFVGYLLFLKRAMRELDPSAVIPERVRSALDTLAEGLLIVDQKGLIIFSNQAFAGKTDLTPATLVGRDIGSLQWEISERDSDGRQLPWLSLLEGRGPAEKTTVKLVADLKRPQTFAVNATPISSSEGNVRGALITFDDVTVVEEKNEELRRALGKLERSQRQIKRQNQELQVLATRDPLTGLLNRRSLFQGFDALLSEARDEGERIACIMVDIDHFKAVNDNFGHAVGDKVIKSLAKTLADFSRPNDLIGRFGGEEFCAALPGLGCDGAAAVAERIRVAIQSGQGGHGADALRITSSFGVSDLSNGATTVAELIDQADKALYVAKDTGRNRVVSWSSAVAGDPGGETSKMLPADPQLATDLDGPDQQLEAETRQSGQRLPEGDGSGEGDEKVLVLHSGRAPSDDPLTAPRPDLDDGAAAKPVPVQPNRLLLFDRVEQAIRRSNRYKTHIAVMAVEFEGIQRVNDTLGISVGDALTKTVISRFKGMLRKTDTVSLNEDDEAEFSVSRFRGNEVVVLLTDLKQTDLVTTVMQRLLTAASEPIEVEGTEIYLDADVGVSLYPIDGDDPDTLLSHAGSAMREAKKRTGRNNFQFYSADVNRRSKQQLRLEADLRRALDRGEFVVFYQPKVDLKSGAILGMEALLRWQHPELGLLPPNEFIPLAERSRLIDGISQRVIRSVCHQILAWKDAGYADLMVAVNLSPVEFRNPNLAEQVIRVLDETGVPASALEIEITESAVMQNIDTAIDILIQLNEAGVGISVDDFGTGYSSLSYLKRFPLSKVKIDRSFISDFVRVPNDAAIVSAIIAMAHSLGLLVVAEGVETDEQLRFLQDLQCDEIQGYLVSRPLPSEEVSELLSHSASIRRMVTDHGAAFTQLTTQQGGSGVFGILNEFPAMSGGNAHALRRSVGGT